MTLLQVVVLVVAMFVFSHDTIASPKKITMAQTSELSRALKHKINTENVTCQVLSDKGLKPYQIKNMYTAFQYGKSRNMGLSLAAIAFKESSAGNPRFMVNPKDPSAGMFGVTLDNALRKLGLKETPENLAMVEDMLVNSHGASAWFSMEILGYWLAYHNGDWFKAYRSYNGGFYMKFRGTPESYKAFLTRTWKYATETQNLTRVIKQCNWK